MTDDIVNRLNEEIRAEVWGLLVDARNEIERLRAEVNRLTFRSCATCRFGYIDSVGMADCAMFDKVFKPDHYCAKWEARRG